MTNGLAKDDEVAPTLIIGAGPAGLAVAACLKRAGVSSVILEHAAAVGAAWRTHYDRLHLHTAKAFSALPFFDFPRAYPRYPSRDQVIRYLEAYAHHFELAPRFGQQVLAARPEQDRWMVQTQDQRFRSTNLVVAAGLAREPFLPQWPGRESFQGAMLHSSHYRNGAPFRNQRVLVVGFGNSGGEIAIDLVEYGADVALAIRSPVNVLPRDLAGIPIQLVGMLEQKLPLWLADALNGPVLRIALGDLRRYGLRTPSSGPITQIQRTARIPLIDVGTIDLIKRGTVTIYPGIARFIPEGVVFEDGQHGAFAAVILATGYRPRVDSFLQGVPAAYDAQGVPLSSGQAAAPGLYFCGYHVTQTGMLREIGLEARRIAAAIAQNA